MRTAWVWLVTLCVVTYGVASARTQPKPKPPEFEAIQPLNAWELVDKFTRQKQDLDPYRVWLINKSEGSYVAIAEKEEKQPRGYIFLTMVKVNGYRINKMTNFKFLRVSETKATFVIHFHKVGAAKGAKPSVFSIMMTPKPRHKDAA